MRGRSCVSSMTRSGWIRPPRSLCRLSLVGCWRSRSGSCSPRGSRVRSFGISPELEVHGLRNGDARALLGSAVQFMLDARVRDRIIAEMHGNPLALIELPRGLSATQLAGGFGLLAAEALTVRIEESFVRRLVQLPDDRANAVAGGRGRAGRRSAAALARGRAARDRPGGRRSARRRTGCSRSVRR